MPKRTASTLDVGSLVTKELRDMARYSREGIDIVNAGCQLCVNHRFTKSSGFSIVLTVARVDTFGR